MFLRDRKRGKREQEGTGVHRVEEWWVGKGEGRGGGGVGISL